MKEFYDAYKTWIHAGIAVILVLAVAWIIWKAYKYIKAQFDPSQQLEVNESNLSYSEAEFELFADQLESAMDGAGTDEEAVYHVFEQMDTADDLKQLIKSFGTRDYGITNKAQNLLQWLRDEMDVEELVPIQTIFNNLEVAF